MKKVLNMLNNKNYCSGEVKQLHFVWSGFWYNDLKLIDCAFVVFTAFQTFYVY